MNTRFASLPVVLRSILTGAASIATIGVLSLPSVTRAELVSSWTQYSGSISSGLNTASPVLGNGTSGSESADSQTIYASTATSHTLSSVGDSISLSGGVTFTGLNTPDADQFRFGLYDVNGQSGATGWLGYFASNSGASAGPTYSRLWERANPNTGSFGSGTGATAIANVNASPSNTSFVSGDYTFSLTITRVSTGLSLAWTLIGTDVSYSVSGTFTDTTPLTYTFNRVGFFAGGSLDADQVGFSNVDVTFTSAVPEPASWGTLAACFAFAAVCMRRRSRA
ncbi:MAG: PEP-CTERM sorting domain-containing protein [Opitutaceae bacterium]|jgi:hypothetical protein